MKKIVLILVPVLVIIGGVYFLTRNSADEYSGENAVLAIRGFKHDQLFAAGGNTEHYQVEVGEEFKVLWIIHMLEETGLVSWQGPAGVGNGTSILKAPATEVSDLKVFTATAPGTAEFVLTTGVADKTETSKIIVEIK